MLGHEHAPRRRGGRGGANGGNRSQGNNGHPLRACLRHRRTTGPCGCQTCARYAAIAAAARHFKGGPA